ncbi:MAG: M28 family peptidase [Acetobacteraceae bacterium]
MRDTLSSVLGRIWTSPRIGDDFAQLAACGGRFAGTESEARAREFLAGRIAEATGAPVTREPVSYRGWTRGPASIAVAERPPFPAVGLVRTPGTPPHGLSARLIDLGRGTPEDITRAAEAVRGAIVLARHEFMMAEDHVHRRRKYDAARAAGAAGFVIAFHAPGCLSVTGSSGDGGPGHIPAVGVSFETAAALSAHAGRDVTLRTSGAFADAVAENLVAAIPGRDQKRVVLSAHYDGHDQAASAIDNASGVAAAIAAAEALSDVVPTLPRGLELALFSVEEWALIGSRVHLDRLDARARAEIACNVNLDSVAGDATLTAITGGFPGVAEFVRRALEPTGLAVGLHHGFMANSDHANFVRHGIPAFRLCAGFAKPESNLRFLLTAADTPDKVRLTELKTAASIAAALVLAACTDPALPAPIAAAEGRRIAGF